MKQSVYALAMKNIFISEIENINREELELIWSKLNFNYKPPSILSLLRQEIAYELQRRENGGLKDSERLKIARLMKDPGDKESLKTTKKDTELFSEGQILRKRYKGIQIEVTYKGKSKFEYNNQSYKSLSAVAKDITGVHQSGPKFFNLGGGKNGS